MNHHTPPQDLITEMASIIGLEAALHVVRDKGGVRAHFIRKPKPDNWLSMLIGLEPARALGAHLCGSSASIELAVPLGRKRRDIERWHIIARMLGETHSNAAIARAVGCDYKTVQRIRNGKRKNIAMMLRVDRAQGQLF